MRQRIATPLIQRTQGPSHAVELKFPKFRRTFHLGLQEQGGDRYEIRWASSFIPVLIMEYEAGGKEISFDLRLSGIANVHLGLKPFAKTGSIIHSLGEADQGPQAHEPYRQIWGHRLQ